MTYVKSSPYEALCTSALSFRWHIRFMDKIINVPHLSVPLKGTSTLKACESEMQALIKPCYLLFQK